MMKTLRKKFILFAMSAVTILLVVLIGAINGLNWIILDEQSDSVLHMLTSAGEKFGQMELYDRRPFAPALDADTIKAARFFTVWMDQSGKTLEVNIEQISSVTTEQAVQYAQRVTAEQGRIEGYKYEVRHIGPDRLIFFMDTANQWRNFIVVLRLSTAIALACWIAILPLVVLLSGWFAKPIVAGMEKQKQFITNAGHELKTPLAIIQSNNDASTLIHGETKYSRNIRQQTQRLNVLMTNLLTLAKLDEEAKLPSETVDISQLIAGMLPTYGDAALEKQILFTASIQPGVELQVHRDTFQQMILILLDNAVKYTPENGTIHLTLNSKGGRVLIVEENTCQKATQEDPERLFERFYRGDTARTQDGSNAGYGIGLSAARAIAESFGGTLAAEYPDAGRIRFTARF